MVAMAGQQSIVAYPRPAPTKRSLKQVPFVELFNGRLQGVVSSGSSISRVYVSFIVAGTGDFYCSTNNRPCGGLGSSPCKHLAELVANALAQLGDERVARYLGCPKDEVSSAYSICQHLGGSKRKEEAGMVFARFLDYLRYVELFRLRCSMFFCRPSPIFAWRRPPREATMNASSPLSRQPSRLGSSRTQCFTDPGASARRNGSEQGAHELLRRHPATLDAHVASFSIEGAWRAEAGRETARPNASSALGLLSDYPGAVNAWAKALSLADP